jgi:hypothetical protein
MGVKGSKNTYPYGYNTNEYTNDYLAYHQNQQYQQMPMHHSIQALNNLQTTTNNNNNNNKTSPIQSSSRLVSSNNEEINFENDNVNNSKSSTINNNNNKKNNIGSPRRKPSSSAEVSPISQTKSSPKHLSKNTLLQELLECPICMNLYETPTVLPCQHTFCKSCIVSLKNSDTAGNIMATIVCPICRESHVLPNGIDALTSNYTMKRLIELESMVVPEKKEKKREKTAKCFVCQKHSTLKICNDCSYMLCKECISDPNHDLIIESKLHSKVSKQIPDHNNDRNRFATMVKSDTRFNKQMFDYSERLDVYSEPQVLIDEKLKLILLCHSAHIELQQQQQHLNKLNESSDNSSDSYRKQPEIYEDEFGKCSTYSKISISMNDRLITLKKIVEKKFGISLDDQIIVYKDKILKNDLKLLNAFHLRQFSRIHIFDERDLKENFNDCDDDLYGTVVASSQPPPPSAQSPTKQKLIKKERLYQPPSTLLVDENLNKKMYVSNELIVDNTPTRVLVKRDRSLHKQQSISKPSNQKFLYDNNSNLTSFKRQNKYYSSNMNHSRYVNSNHYSNF